MRIILHGGLHKSGTTYIQDRWRRMYADHPTTWYPAPPPGPPGHHRIARPLLAGFVDALDPDLAAASTAYHLRGRTSRQSFGQILEEAERRRVEQLVISSEDFDRVVPPDGPGLEALLGRHEVTLVLTATRPVHRWCSGWQELVRHGLPHYPAEGAHHVLRFAALAPGRMQEIVHLLPSSRRVIRLVRPSPPEPELAVDLSRALGLPSVDLPEGAKAGNPSLGVNAEIVLRMNRAGVATGTDRAVNKALRRMEAEGIDYRESSLLAERYAVPRTVRDAAVLEQEWLRQLPTQPDSTLLDPHGLLETWTDDSLPEWYEQISRREAVVPGLDPPEDLRTELWRARQQLVAYDLRLKTQVQR